MKKQGLNWTQRLRLARWYLKRLFRPLSPTWWRYQLELWDVRHRDGTLENLWEILSGKNR